MTELRICQRDLICLLIAAMIFCNGNELWSTFQSIATLHSHKKHKLAKIVAEAGRHSLTQMINPFAACEAGAKKYFSSWAVGCMNGAGRVSVDIFNWCNLGRGKDVFCATSPYTNRIKNCKRRNSKLLFGNSGKKYTLQTLKTLIDWLADKKIMWDLRCLLRLLFCNK